MSIKPVVVKMPIHAAAIIRQPDGAISVTVAGQGPAGNNGSDGVGPGVLMTWSTTTTDADPGGGYVRADNASLASATEIYVDKANRAGSSIAALLAAVPRGLLIITDPETGAQASLVLGDVEDATGYVKFPVSGHSGATAFANDLPISMQFPDPGLAAMVRLDAEDQQINGGARVTTKNLGNLAGQEITLDPGDRPVQKLTNNGAGTIKPGTDYGPFRLIIVNTADAGAIDTDEFYVYGHDFDTDNGSMFLCGVEIYEEFAVLDIRKVL